MMSSSDLICVYVHVIETNTDYKYHGLTVHQLFTVELDCALRDHRARSIGNREFYLWPNIFVLVGTTPGRHLSSPLMLICNLSCSKYKLRELNLHLLHSSNHNIIYILIAFFYYKLSMLGRSI